MLLLLLVAVDFKLNEKEQMDILYETKTERKKVEKNVLKKKGIVSHVFLSASSHSYTYHGLQFNEIY